MIVDRDIYGMLVLMDNLVFMNFKYCMLVWNRKEKLLMDEYVLNKCIYFICIEFSE